MSRTAFPMSAVTVPAFGFGISPRGPSTRPARPTRGITSGVATAASNSIFPWMTSFTRSSAPTRSAPASLASRALSPVANAATRTDLADLVPVRLAGALLQSRGRLQQLCGRRLLGDEAERPVLIDRQFHRDDLPHLRLGRLVVLAAELHDVHAVLAQGRADRWRGRSLPRPDLELDDGRDLLSSALRGGCFWHVASSCGSS